MYAEDLDLGWRLQQAGLGARATSRRAVIDHEVAAATTQHFGRRAGAASGSARPTAASRAAAARAYARAIALLNLLGAAAPLRASMALTQARGPGCECRALHRRWIKVHMNALDPREKLDERGARRARSRRRAAPTSRRRP